MPFSPPAPYFCTATAASANAGTDPAGQSGDPIASERVVTAFDGKDSLRWQTVNDGVMGGRSRGDSSRTPNGTLRFAGEISLENNGGFSSIRTRPQDLQLGGYDGLAIRVRGDGRTYKLALRTSGTSSWIACWADFATTKDTWTTVRIPFSNWVPIHSRPGVVFPIAGWRPGGQVALRIRMIARREISAAVDPGSRLGWSDEVLAN